SAGPRPRGRPPSAPRPPRCRSRPARGRTSSTAPTTGAAPRSSCATASRSSSTPDGARPHFAYARGQTPRRASMKQRTRAIGNRIALTTWRSLVECVDDRIHRDAAQVGFFVMLSFVPLALLLVAAFGLIFDDADVRGRVVKTVFENI